ncbi:MAG: hypothetical protein H6720_08330 [Sandaracinus sp.]|nr:hypothetical protein [Sandaracinus sp.]
MQEALVDEPRAVDGSALRFEKTADDTLDRVVDRLPPGLGADREAR